MMRKKIIVTGASGYLGQKIFDKLNVLAAGQDCYFISRSPGYMPWSELGSIGLGPNDVVINCASPLAHEINNFDYFDSQKQIVSNLQPALQASQAKLINVSSVSVYEAMEKANQGKLNYAKSKLFVEQAVESFCHDSISIRIPSIIGKPTNGGLYPTKNFFSDLFSKSRDVVTIINSDQKTNAFIDSDDLASFLVKLSLKENRFTKKLATFASSGFIIKKELVKIFPEKQFTCAFCDEHSERVFCIKDIQTEFNFTPKSATLTLEDLKKFYFTHG